MGSREGESRPSPKPLVPMMMPLVQDRDLRRWISVVISWGGAERGRDANV